MANIIEDEGFAPAHEIDNWDFPLWSEILPGFWMGGTDDDDTIDFAVDTNKSRKITKDHFDTVVTLYAWALPTDWLVDELRFGFYDSDINHIDMKRLEQVVDYAHAAWKNGNKVLVRCQAGLNRSGLTAALVLMKDGYSAKDAINLLRTNRTKWALCNRQFEEFLLTKDATQGE